MALFGHSEGMKQEPLLVDDKLRPDYREQSEINAHNDEALKNSYMHQYEKLTAKFQ